MNHLAPGVIVSFCKERAGGLLVLSLICCSSSNAIASQAYDRAYDFKIVAESGNISGFPIASFKQSVALNDNGYVAFIAVGDYGAKAVFLAEPSGNGHLLHKIAETSSGDYGGVSLNKRNDVALTFRATAGGVTVANVKRYESGAGGYEPVDVVKATTARHTVTIDWCILSGSGSCPFTYRFRKEGYDNILNPVSMNDSGKIALIGEAFSDLGRASYFLTTQITYSGGNEAEEIVPYRSFASRPDFNPVIDNEGNVVARVGGGENSPILLFNPDFSFIETIADEANFSRLGLRPGLSKDGQVVVFYGNLSDTGASALNAAQEALVYGSGPATDVNRLVVVRLTSGPGIFVSIYTAAGRIIQRIAGTLSHTFSSFDADHRIAVSSLTAVRHHVTIAYTATGSSKRGLYAQRINFVFPKQPAGSAQNIQKPAGFRVTQPMVVVQKDDVIFQDENGNNSRDSGEPSLSGTVSDLAINEGSNNRGLGEVGFWVKTTTGTESIVKAVPWFDSPFVDSVRRNPHQPERESGNTTVPSIINQIILHATAGPEERTLNAFIAEKYGTHYVIGRNAPWRITQLVREQKRAFHATNYRENCVVDHESNDWSIGIELVDDHPNPGHWHDGWAPPEMLTKAALLVEDIGTRRHVPLWHLQPIPWLVVGNEDNGNRPSGEEFRRPTFAWPFQTLDGNDDGIPDYSQGSGIYPDPTGESRCSGIRDGFNFQAKGIIAHGQVIDRMSGKNDPKSFDWPAFMTMVNKGIGLTLNSPANLLVTDSQGRRTGYDSESGQTLLQIPGSQFSGPNTEPQTLSIPSALDGDYTIQVVGTSNGTFRLDVLASDLNGGLLQTRIAGTTSPGLNTTYILQHDAVEGSATKVLAAGNLPPVAFDDFATATSNSTVVINVLANDNDPEALLNTNSVAVLMPPANGTVSVNPTNGTVAYTPTNGFVGTNTFTYTVQDNQVTISLPGIVTVIVAEPVVVTNSPPLVFGDSATTANGASVKIDVLANDYAPDGILDPSSVAVSVQPTNGSAVVDLFSGEITYTPSPGSTNLDSFRYTVRDDLGTPSAEASVIITNTVVNAGGRSLLTPIPNYLVTQITGGAVDHRYPRINNSGEVVYQSSVGGLQQIWKNGTGDPELSTVSPLTFPTTIYGGAVSPAIADDGSFICYRENTNGSHIPKDILKYPGPAVAATNPQPTIVFSASGNPSAVGLFLIAGKEPSLSSDGKPIYSYVNGFNSLSGESSFYDTYLVTGGTAVSQGNWGGSRPDVNDAGQFTFDNGSQIFLNNKLLTNGTHASVNDVPRDNPEVVYVVGTNLMSTIFGKLDGGPSAEFPISGTWVDANRNGILVFEKLVNGHYQIFKAYPWELRIISQGGLNGLVGLPYRYDSDNVVEAYGGPEPKNDPRGATPIRWSIASGPPGFTISPNTGQINWIPSAPGSYTVVIRAENENDGYGYVEDLETIHITVAQSAMEVLDAVDFLTPGTPDLPTIAANYTTSGSSRIGALADGASRILLRVPLLGAVTNSFPNLHFAIAGTNQMHAGLLRSISSTTWSFNVPATITTANGTNFALCLYESPHDFDLALQPVTLRLYSSLLKKAYLFAKSDLHGARDSD